MRFHQTDEACDTVLAEGKHVRLIRRNGWEFADRRGTTGVVSVVAVTDDGKLLVTEQFRPPVGTRVVELPAGLAGDLPSTETEDLAEAARRELEEETGYRAEGMDLLTAGPASAGLSSEVITLFRARGLTRTGPGGGDAHEDIEVHELPLDDAAKWLREREREGRLVDPKVYAGLYFAGR